MYKEMREQAAAPLAVNCTSGRTGISKTKHAAMSTRCARAHDMRSSNGFRGWGLQWRISKTAIGRIDEKGSGPSDRFAGQEYRALGPGPVRTISAARRVKRRNFCSRVYFSLRCAVFHDGRASTGAIAIGCSTDLEVRKLSTVLPACKSRGAPTGAVAAARNQKKSAD